jgi:oxygen-independent coproporphyrinogen-3 oxidase
MTVMGAGLERELEWIEPGTPLGQLFVGGGTPTALPPELLDRLLGAIRARSLAGSEVDTVETSPETLTPEHLDVLAVHGVGRASMGIQSLDTGILERVNRQQTVDQVLAACDLLVSSSLTTANVDLIYGLPGQTHASFARDLETLAARGIGSLTFYNLRSNEKTPIRRALSDDDRLDLGDLMAWRAFVKERAEDQGYAQTRWHTFKRLDTSAAKHEHADTLDEKLSGYQLGVGNSARSSLGHTLYRNHERLETWLERVEAGQSPVEQVFRLDVDDRKTQLVARTLGDGKRLARDAYERAFESSIDADFPEVLERLRRGGLVEDDGRSLELSEDGRLVYDLVTLAFYPEHAKRWLAGHPEARFVEAGGAS